MWLILDQMESKQCHFDLQRFSASLMYKFLSFHRPSSNLITSLLAVLLQAELVNAVMPLLDFCFFLDVGTIFLVDLWHVLVKR